MLLASLALMLNDPKLKRKPICLTKAEKHNAGLRAKELTAQKHFSDTFSKTKQTDTPNMPYKTLKLARI